MGLGRNTAIARLSSTNQIPVAGPILADGRSYKSLPPIYYSLTQRITRAVELRDEMERSDPLWVRLTGKIETLTDELQATVNQTLGAALCPVCTKVPISMVTLRSRQAMRVCCRHDLEVIRLHGRMQWEPPGTGEIPSSALGSTSSGY